MNSNENIIVDMQESNLFLPTYIDELTNVSDSPIGPRAIKTFFFLTATCRKTRTILEWDISFDKRPNKSDLDQFRQRAVEGLKSQKR